jgi:PKHD-type hydroxylase
MFPIPSRPSENTCSYAYMAGPRGFTATECDRIIALGLQYEVSRIYGDKIDASVRSSEVAPIALGDDTTWVFERIRAAAVAVNSRWWNFDLTGIYPYLQLVRYQKTQHQSWHRDGIDGAFSHRKLTVSVQLTDQRAFKGGSLQFLDELEPTIPPPEHLAQGNIVFFPGYQLHQVTPVTKGTRHALLTFIEGPPFR